MINGEQKTKKKKLLDTNWHTLKPFNLKTRPETRIWWDASEPD